MVSVVTAEPMWDAIGTIMIGVLLIVVAVFVAIEVKAMLIGQSAAACRRRKATSVEIAAGNPRRADNGEIVRVSIASRESVLLQRPPLLAHRLTIERDAVEIYRCDLSRIADVVERVGVEHDEARALAGGERPEVAQSHEFGGSFRSSNNCSRR